MSTPAIRTLADRAVPFSASEGAELVHHGIKGVIVYAPWYTSATWSQDGKVRERVEALAGAGLEFLPLQEAPQSGQFTSRRGSEDGQRFNEWCAKLWREHHDRRAVLYVEASVGTIASAYCGGWANEVAHGYIPIIGGSVQLIDAMAGKGYGFRGAMPAEYMHPGNRYPIPDIVHMPTPYWQHREGHRAWQYTNEVDLGLPDGPVDLTICDMPLNPKPHP